MLRIARYLLIPDWGRAYNGYALTNNLATAVIVTIMLIPQSLAYAMLAGLNPYLCNIHRWNFAKASVSF